MKVIGFTESKGFVPREWAGLREEAAASSPPEHGRPLQRFRFMPDFDPSSVPLGVDEEVGDTPPGTIRAARQTERRRHPQQQPEQGLGDAWILIGFIVVLGLIFVVAAWVLAGSR